jgi:hypothetical protein
MNAITVGYWETRDGRKARVLCTDAKFIYPCVGYIELDHGDVKLVTWTLGGRFHGSDSDHNEDLIRPWVDRPAVDWSKEREWVKAVARDHGGRWWRYDREPIHCMTGWDDAPCKFSQCMHPSEYPQFTGSWRDSLCLRPEGGRK